MADIVNIPSLLTKYPIISDQVNAAQLQVILGELEKTLEKKIEGDIVEFGCYIGTTSLFIRRLLDMRRETKTFHVYDSFEGLPEKSSQDNSGAGEQFKAGELSVSKKQFLHEFQKANLKPPVVHKGWFGELSSSDVPDTIAFAFLDGDFYKSIKDSLQLVLPNMSRGGIVIVDDYAREALPGAARAVHDLLPRTPVQTVHNLGIIHT
jgi:O-methyltransferase